MSEAARREQVPTFSGGFVVDAKDVDRRFAVYCSWLSALPYRTPQKVSWKEGHSRICLFLSLSITCVSEVFAYVLGGFLTSSNIEVNRLLDCVAYKDATRSVSITRPEVALPINRLVRG